MELIDCQETTDWIKSVILTKSGEHYYVLGVNEFRRTSNSIYTYL